MAHAGDRETRRIHELLAVDRSVQSREQAYVAGIDEAGRGPLAGPVVAAAVVFDSNVYIEGINDSKKLSSAKRSSLAEQIQEAALDVGIGIASVQEIDSINILRATHVAMGRAVAGLHIKPLFLLVDGRDAPDMGWPCQSIIGGDGKSFSIAAASIIAKVTRDAMMTELDRQYPLYGFQQNKGYGTKKHVEALKKHGKCPGHRHTFHVKGWGERPE